MHMRKLKKTIFLEFLLQSPYCLAIMRGAKKTERLWFMATIFDVVMIREAAKKIGKPVSIFIMETSLDKAQEILNEKRS